MTSEEIKNYTLRVSQANVSGLADILVDLSIDNLASSIEALENDDNALFVLHSKKAERCIIELIHSNLFFHMYIQNYQLIHLFVLILN
jgi:hypothetical protein